MKVGERVAWRGGFQPASTLLQESGRENSLERRLSTGHYINTGKWERGQLEEGAVNWHLHFYMRLGESVAWAVNWPVHGYRRLGERAAWRGGC